MVFLKNCVVFFTFLAFALAQTNAKRSPFAASYYQPPPTPAAPSPQPATVGYSPEAAQAYASYYGMMYNQPPPLQVPAAPKFRSMGSPMGAMGSPIGMPMIGSPIGMPTIGSPIGMPMIGSPMGMPMMESPIGMGIPQGYPQQMNAYGSYPSYG